MTALRTSVAHCGQQGRDGMTVHPMVHDQALIPASRMIVSLSLRLAAQLAARGSPTAASPSIRASLTLRPTLT
jgi:hypothetical protein